MSTLTQEVVAFEEARARARRRRARVWLPVSVVAVMLMALLGIALYDYTSTRDDVLALSKGVISNLQSRIETEVTAYLQPIPGVVRMSRDLLTDSKVADVRLDLIEPLGLGILRNVPQLTSFIIGNSAGEFFMVRRYRDGQQQGLETKIIRRPADGSAEPQMKITRRGADGEVVSEESPPWDGYDPRTRPWFQGAAEAKGPYWTDVYPFFTEQAAGITGSIPYIDAAGRLVAVVGADVKLESLSRFLGQLAIGRSGVALIVDREGRVIAHPDVPLVRKDPNGGVRLTRVEDIDSAIVGRAFDRFRVEGHGRRDFELAGRRYISSASSLNPLLQRDWSVLVVVPEDDFVGFVQGNVGKTLGMGLAVIALAAILAGLLIRQGLRADREASRILARQAQLDAQSEAFGSLAMQSALSGEEGEEALAPVTEAMARSSRARRASLWQLERDADRLSCTDCFDQETEGHTRGGILLRADHPGLFGALDAGEVLSEVDTATDASLARLYRSYLQPLGCRALLAVPISVQGRVSGAVCLEDGGGRDEWPREVERFAQAIANLLAVREAVGGGARDGASPSDIAAVVGDAVPDRAGGGTLGRIDTDLSQQRAAAFAAALAQRAGDAGVTGAGVIDRLAVMSLHFTDAAVLAGPVAGAGEETVVEYLIRELETAGAAHGLSYLKFLTDQVVAAVDPREDADQGMERLADFALVVQGVCERLFAERQAPLAFRIGLDLGPVIGSVVGRERRAFNLWGEAAQMASSMAHTGLPGTIQVTETVYRALNGRFLFQLRGHHYLGGVGEFSTYLMGGRL